MDEPQSDGAPPKDPRLVALAWAAAGLVALLFAGDAARGAAKAASPSLVAFNYALAGLVGVGGLLALAMGARAWWGRPRA